MCVFITSHTSWSGDQQQAPGHKRKTGTSHGLYTNMLGPRTSCIKCQQRRFIQHERAALLTKVLLLPDVQQHPCPHRCAALGCAHGATKHGAPIRHHKECVACSVAGMPAPRLQVMRGNEQMPAILQTDAHTNTHTTRLEPIKPNACLSRRCPLRKSTHDNPTCPKRTPAAATRNSSHPSPYN